MTAHPMTAAGRLRAVLDRLEQAGTISPEEALSWWKIALKDGMPELLPERLEYLYSAPAPDSAASVLPIAPQDQTEEA